MGKQLVFIVGAGGHAKMVIEALRSMHQYELFGCLDTQIKSNTFLGVPVLLENDQTLQTLLDAKALAVVALGDNRRREEVTGKLVNRGFGFATIIAQSSYVSPSASIAAGSVIMPKAVVGAMAQVGQGVILNTACSIDHDTIIGDFAHVAPGCHLAGNVTVGPGALLGIGTCVIPDRHIGAWATLGANSTVVHDIPEGVTCFGTPARQAPGASS